MSQPYNNSGRSSGFHGPETPCEAYSPYRRGYTSHNTIFDRDDIYMKTPFKADTEYTRKQYKDLGPWEEIRFLYEVGGQTHSEIAQKFLIPLVIVEEQHIAGDWKQHDTLTTAELDERTNEFYKRTRMGLTTLVSYRTAELFNSLITIEDRMISQIEKLLTDYENDALEGTKPDTMDISRLATTITKLHASYALLQEAVIAPAQKDRKATLEDGNVAIEDILDELDGDSRGLPVPPTREEDTKENTI